MLAIDRFMLAMVNLSKLSLTGIVEKQLHVVIEGAVIFLECQDLIGSLLGDNCSDFLLTPHGINGHRRTPQI